MYVKRIIEFINKLQLQELNLADIDTSLFNEIKARFTERSDEDFLSENDIEFLLSQFEKRATQSCDTSADCTLFPNSSINQDWLSLAKDLSIDAKKKSYLEVLFPAVRNSRDFNDTHCGFMKISSPGEIYFSETLSIMYSKESLIHHIGREGFSTHTNAERKNLRALRLKELARLRKCEQKFLIDGIHYVGFWNFIHKSVLPKLNNKSNQMPHHLLPPFLFLIESYYDLKEKKDSFDSFERQWIEFLDFLYKLELNDINSFYGIKLDEKSPDYLLDLLIVIHEAKDYTVDTQFQILLVYLARRYPSFAHISTILDSAYHAITLTDPALSLICKESPELHTKSHHGDPLHDQDKIRSEPLAIKKGTTPRTAAIDPLLQCKYLLLSLFTSIYDPVVLSKKIKLISCCDIQRTVPEESEILYTNVLSLIKSDSVAEMSIFYEKHLNSMNLTNSSNPQSWFTLELMMHSVQCFLQYFQNSSEQSERDMNDFLDELIRTYCQNFSILYKELRVNILLHELMSKISPVERRALSILLDLYTKEMVRSSFLENCTTHIGRRLSQIWTSSNEPRRAGEMYPPHHKEAYILIGQRGLVSVQKIVEQYKSQLIPASCHMRQCASDRVSELRLNFLAYFSKLEAPLLSCTEQKEAKGRMLDSLGAPT